MTASGPSGIVGPTHWQRTAPHFNETVRPWQGRHGYVRHARRSTPPRKRNATASRRGHLWRLLRVGITLLRSVGWPHRHQAVETQLWAGWWRPYVRKVYETTHGRGATAPIVPCRNVGAFNALNLGSHGRIADEIAFFCISCFYWRRDLSGAVRRGLADEMG
jgi:hypothetical protein